MAGTTLYDDDSERIHAKLTIYDNFTAGYSGWEETRKPNWSLKFTTQEGEIGMREQSNNLRRGPMVRRTA
jgi:hypothetical protein